MAFYILLSFFFGWLIILSYYVIKIRKHYFSLTERTKKQRIDEILDSINQSGEKNKQDITQIKKEIDIIVNNSSVFFNKFGLIRYNPFGKSEGEQSFVLSLLDSRENGMVLNFIYTHEGIRIYVKKVVGGKGEDSQLSEEERQAIIRAK